MLDGVRRNDAIDVEEGFHRALDFGHPEDVAGVDARAEIGGGFDLTRGQIYNFFDTVDDQSHLHRLAGGELHLDDDDAGAVGEGCLQTELEPKVDNGDDAAAKIE